MYRSPARLAALCVTHFLFLSHAAENAWDSALPPRIELRGEYRGRGESALGWLSSGNVGVYMNRLRLDVDLRVSNLVRLSGRLQDARAACISCGSEVEGLRNTFETALGFVEVGHREEGWSVRAGRQELSMGDERLLGSDSDLDPFGLAWDAVQIGYGSRRARARAFAGYKVHSSAGSWDRFKKDDLLAGAQFSWQPLNGRLIEPYVLWKRAQRLEQADIGGSRDVLTGGFRLLGPLGKQLDYSVELAVQASQASRSFSAWAGHWDVGWRPWGESRPRLSFEYNYASGDRHPVDGREDTFDDLYPAGYNQFGLIDSFAWRNIAYPAASVDWRLSATWSVAAEVRGYRLASLADGLYVSGLAEPLRCPTSGSSHAGNQVLLAATYQPTLRWQVQAGFGHLFEGEFLRAAGYRSGITSVTVSTTFAFPTRR